MHYPSPRSKSNKNIGSKLRAVNVFGFSLQSMIIAATHLPDLALIAGPPCKSTLPSRVTSSDSSSNLLCAEFSTQQTFQYFSHSLLIKLKKASDAKYMSHSFFQYLT